MIVTLGPVYLVLDSKETIMNPRINYNQHSPNLIKKLLELSQLNAESLDRSLIDLVHIRASLNKWLRILSGYACKRSENSRWTRIAPLPPRDLAGVAIIFRQGTGCPRMDGSRHETLRGDPG